MINLELTTSTMDVARKAVQHMNLTEPLFINATSQTKGRGKQAREYQCFTGGIYLTMVVPESLLGNEANLGRFVLGLGVGAIQAIQQQDQSLDLSLKWVNDLFYQGKKCAGILVEEFTGQQKYYVCGIGINLAALAGKLENLPQATTLPDTVKREPLIKAIQQNWLWMIDHYMDEELLKLENELSFLTGKEVSVAIGKERIIGQVRGLDKEGRLLLQTEGGMQKISYGEVDKIFY